MSERADEAYEKLRDAVTHEIIQFNPEFDSAYDVADAILDMVREYGDRLVEAMLAKTP